MVVRNKIYGEFVSFRHLVVRPDETHLANTSAGFIFLFLFSRIFMLNRSERGQVCVVHNGKLVFGQPINISSPFR
jgi:hypothetical protein